MFLEIQFTDKNLGYDGGGQVVVKKTNGETRALQTFDRYNDAKDWAIDLAEFMDILWLD